MTVKEINKSVKNMKEFTKKITSSKAKSIKFLTNAGICTSNGHLAKAYK